MSWTQILKRIEKADEALLKRAREKIDGKTKPLGALGRLEDTAVKMAAVQGNLNPALTRKGLFVFAADHGVAQEGVSAFPSEVTPQMVMNFLRGGAAINILCRQQAIDLFVVDVGVNFAFENPRGLINKKIGPGTRNFLKAPAMTMKEAEQAIQAGIDAFLTEYEKQPFDIVGLGDMGIGNTTSSAAVIAAASGLPAEKVTGRGTGVDDLGFARKVETVRKALGMHRPNAADPLDILHKIGGFEIGGIAGVVLAAARQKTAVVLDGIISTAGGLLAYLLNPKVSDYCFAGHKSVELGQKAALDRMGIIPLLDLDMRLGEGTGAALAMHLIDASCRILGEMASFQEAGVTQKD